MGSFGNVNRTILKALPILQGSKKRKVIRSGMLSEASQKKGLTKKLQEGLFFAQKRICTSLRLPEKQDKREAKIFIKTEHSAKVL